MKTPDQMQTYFEKQKKMTKASTKLVELLCDLQGKEGLDQMEIVELMSGETSRQVSMLVRLLDEKDRPI